MLISLLLLFPPLSLLTRYGQQSTEGYAHSSRLSAEVRKTTI
jgi:hypothetical protein